MSTTLPAPMLRVPLGRVTPSGEVLISDEWARYLSHAVPRQVVTTADLAAGTAGDLAQLLASSPAADVHVQAQDDAPGPDVHAPTIDDAPGDVAALREELTALRDRVQALELK